MDDDHSESKLIKAAKNEYLLLFFRASTTAMLGLVVTYVSSMRDDIKLMNRDFSAFQIAYAERIAHVEGQLTQINGIVEAHRVRIANSESDVRSLWNRTYEMLIRLGGTPTKSIP